MRVNIIDMVSGDIVGDVSAPRAFFYSDGFQAWRDQVTAEAVQRAIARSDEGRAVTTCFSITVTRGR